MRKVWAGNKVEEKKNTRYLCRQKQSARGVNVANAVACKRMVIMDSCMSDVKKKLKKN